jgi:hypothetical protein
MHKNTLQKIDFSKPIFDQLDRLTAEEKEILTGIPITFKENEKIIFKDTVWKEYLYTNNFWMSSIFFQCWILLFVYQIFSLV